MVDVRQMYITWRRVGDERGVSLVEVVVMLVILGIVLVPLSRLTVKNLTFGGEYVTMTKAIYYAQECMEEVIADYAAEEDGRGYDWVVANWSGSTDVPVSGLSRSVAISAADTLNGVTYVVVQVTVSGADIPNVTLTTWLVE